MFQLRAVCLNPPLLFACQRKQALKCIHTCYDLSFDVFCKFPSVSFLYKTWSVLKEKGSKKSQAKKTKKSCKHSWFLNFIPIESPKDELLNRPYLIKKKILKRHMYSLWTPPNQTSHLGTTGNKK